MKQLLSLSFVEVIERPSNSDAETFVSELCRNKTVCFRNFSNVTFKVSHW